MGGVAGQLEFVGDSPIANDGTAKFAFTHASDYLIVMRNRMGADHVADDGASSDAVISIDSSADADDGNLRTEGPRWLWGVLMACSILFMAGAGAFITIKKRKMGDRSER